MNQLASTSLSDDERALLERFAALLRERLGGGLHAVWLYGSRARAERPSHGDSDVDLLVLMDDDSWEGKRRVHDVLDDSARELHLESLTPWFMPHIHTQEWLHRRRKINSFFIAEVDRDKIVIEGPHESPLR
jgi:predicted nucleotidyltransferase